MDGNFQNGYHGYRGGRNFSHNEKYDSDGPVPDYDDDNPRDVRLSKSPQRDYEDDVAMGTRIRANGYGEVTEREFSRRRSQRDSREMVNRESTESHGRYYGRDYVNHVDDLNRKPENGRNGRPVSGWQNGKIGENNEKVNGMVRNGRHNSKINSGYEEDYGNRMKVGEYAKYEVGDERNEDDKSQLSRYRPRTHGVSRALTLRLQRSMRRTYRSRRRLAEDHDVPKLSYADGIKTIVQRRKHVQRPALSQIGTALSSNLSGDGNDSEDIGLPSNRMNRKTKKLGHRLTALQRRREVNAHDMATLLRLALYEFFCLVL